MNAALRRHRGLSLNLAALLLAACAGTPEHAGEAPSVVEIDEAADAAEWLPAAAPTVIPAGDVHGAMSSRRDRLRRLLKPQIARGDVGAPELRADSLRISWRGRALFARGGAELQPQALGGLSRVAKCLRADGATVLQVVAQQAAADPDDLSERRAAAVAAFLLAEGALAPRVRVQVVDLRQLRASGPAGGAEVDIALVVAPIVQGREALAWIPPAAD